jgi:hypothetical protein
MGRLTHSQAHACYNVAPMPAAPMPAAPMMRAAVAYESMTGNTKRAAELIARGLARNGIETSTFPVTEPDYNALSAADLVIVGTWTDGFVLFGHRPGRSGRLRRFPPIWDKRCVLFVTYALHEGNVLRKFQRLMESRGATVIGGMAIRRDKLDAGARDFVERLLDVPV